MRLLYTMLNSLYEASRPTPARLPRMINGRFAYLCRQEECWTLMERAPDGVCLACGSTDLLSVQSLVLQPHQWEWLQKQQQAPPRAAPPRNTAYELTSLTEPEDR